MGRIRRIGWCKNADIFKKIKKHCPYSYLMFERLRKTFLTINFIYIKSQM